MIAPYVVVFAVSTILVAIAGSRMNQSKLVRWVTSILAIVIVSVFAGIRDFHVGGPDVMIYGNKVFNHMLATPEIGNLMRYANDRGVSGEVAYYFINWIVGRISPDHHVLYTVLAAFNATCILIAILLVRKFGPPAVMWLTYMFTAYVEGFNLLRQSPALSLAVLGVALVLRDKPRLGLIVGASGLLFHNSAVVFFVMWGVAYYLKTRRERIGRAVWVVLLLSIVSLAAVTPLIELLSSSLGDTKYQEYLMEGARGGRAFGIDALYRAVPIAVGIWVLRATRPAKPDQALPYRSRQQARSTSNVAVLTEPKTETPTASTVEELSRRAVIVVLVLLSLELVLLPVREISYPFYRLLAYFGYLRIIGYGMIVGQFKSNRALVSIGAVAFAAAYFWLIVIQRNEAVYESVILDSWLNTLG